MAGKNIGFKSSTITGITTTGTITIASTTGYYKNAIVWLNDATATVPNNKRAVIMEVVDGTHLSILIRSNDAGEAPKYGRSDMTAYNGGTITQHEQFVYNNDDLPLS